MSLLVESVKVKDGRLYNLGYHSERFNRTRKELFDIGLNIDLNNKIIIPAYARKGLFKCRIEYDDHIRLMGAEPIEALGAITSGDDLVALVLQQPPQLVANQRLVVD